MNINFDILEQLRQYFNGELTAAEARTVEQKMASDEVYAYHLRVYKTMSQGVSRAMTPDKEWMKELQNKPLTVPEIIAMEQIIASERASTRKRMLWWIILAGLIIAVAALWIWQPWENAQPTIDQNTPPRLQADDLGKEEEEPAVGSTGISVHYTVEQRMYNAGQPPALTGRNNRVINLQAHSAPELKYLFRSDTLVLYSDNVDKYDRASFDWVTLQSNGATEDFIKINTDFYAIPYTDEKQLLEKIDKDKSAMLKSMSK